MNRYFAHSRCDSKIMHFYNLLMPVTSLTTGNTVYGQERTIERTTNLKIVFS